MAILFTEGFDLHSSISDLVPKWVSYENNNSYISIDTTLGRYGGSTLVLADGTSDYALAKISDDQDQSYVSGGDDICVAFAFKTASSSAPSGSFIFFYLSDKVINSLGSSVYMYASATTGYFNIREGGAGTVRTTTTNICDGNWHWIEARIVTADGTAGITDVYIDGVQVVNITGADTQGTALSTPWLYVSFASSSASTWGDTYIDDVIVYNDVAGPTGDLRSSVDFPIGDSRIETLTVNGAGSFTNLSASGTAANYLNVDEWPYTGDTDYNEDTTANDEDTYNFTSLAGTPSTIHGVMAYSISKCPGLSTTNARLVCYSNTTRTDGSSFTPKFAYSLNGQSFPRDPDTAAAWGASGINAAEFGFEVL